MSESVTVTGMILSAQASKEYDRRLVILTKELGKISAFANGVRRPTVAMSGVSQPFVFGKFTVFAGKNSYTLQNAEVENSFGGMRDDLEAMAYGLYFCEFAETVTREGIPAKEELKVLYRSLSALLKTSIDRELVRAVFEMRMLAVGGIMPQVYECVSCRSKEELIWFSAPAGGCICRKCARNNGFGAEYEGRPLWSVHPSTLYTMQFILSSPIESLYTFKVSEHVLNELQEILKQFLAIHIGKNFKSLDWLNSIKA